MPRPHTLHSPHRALALGGCAAEPRAPCVADRYTGLLFFFALYTAIKAHEASTSAGRGARVGATDGSEYAGDEGAGSPMREPLCPANASESPSPLGSRILERPTVT